MSKEKRFYVKSNFGHWSVIDKNDKKMVVAYSKKSDAEMTANGLNRIRKKENITKMKKTLQTTKGYAHYLKNETIKTIKTKRIADGYYEGKYKGVDFTIQKVSDLPNSEIAWYWQIRNKKVNDWYKSKLQAIQAVKSYIDEQKDN
jgi:hypothetical protein